MTGGLQDSRVGVTERCSICQLLCSKSKVIRCGRCPWSLCVVWAGTTTGIVINWSCQNCRNARDRIIFSSPRAFHLALHFAPGRPPPAGRQAGRQAGRLRGRQPRTIEIDYGPHHRADRAVTDAAIQPPSVNLRIIDSLLSFRGGED